MGGGKTRGVVNFTRVLKEVLWCLVTEGGIFYRRIRLSYGLDDDAVEALRRELISIKQVAADADGERLVWAPQGQSLGNEQATRPHQPPPPLRAAEPARISVPFWPKRDEHASPAGCRCAPSDLIRPNMPRTIFKKDS